MNTDSHDRRCFPLAFEQLFETQDGAMQDKILITSNSGRFRRCFVNRILQNQQGATGLEYAVLSALVALVLLATVSYSGQSAARTFQLVSTPIAIANGGGTVGTTGTNDLGDPDGSQSTIPESGDEIDGWASGGKNENFDPSR